MRWIDRQRQRSEQNALGELIVFFVVLMILLVLWLLWSIQRMEIGQ